MRPHDVQLAYARSPHRFNVVPAGRRSGKTERAKRKLVRRALRGTAFPDPRFFAAAPTREQAKRIYWKDLKRMVPDWAKKGRPLETELCIPLVNGGEIWVLGLDKPERIEGSPWDGGVLDEYGNMRAGAWGENVRPALADRAGWCDLIGVPEGRNHYYETAQMAQAELLERGPASEWGYFHWVSADILPAAEIEAAKRNLDALVFQQEYEASFVNFVGRAYYTFLEADHCRRLIDRYNPAQPLIICLDFNVAPGVAAIAQEFPLTNGETYTAWIGEVWIPENSNTPAVCRKIIADWGEHVGRVEVYGDATGGARGSAKVAGSDWDIAKQDLRAHFGDRVFFRVPKANPAERARLNAVNTRFRSSDGTIRMLVDPSRAPHLVKDFEGVRTLEGGSGEIDKKKDPKLTHISDAAGYYVEARYPVATAAVRTSTVSM